MLAIFNQKLLDFASDIARLRSTGKADDVPALDILKPSVEMLMSFDPKKSQAVFHECVVERYGPQIERRDEKFLLENDYKESAADLGSNTDIVDMVKKVWTKLDDAEKNAIWDHLALLTMLSKRCT